MISIVVPIYNEGKTVELLHKKIVESLRSLREAYEIIFVDDGSTDDTFLNAKKLRPLRLLSLQKNGGQTAAIDVGIQEARGEIIVLLDADLQNDPAEIPRLLKKLEEGFDVVVTTRTNRKDSMSRMIFSKFANLCARNILGVDIHDFGSGLKIYRSRFVKHFRLWGESQVFLPAVAKERGAKICEMPVGYHARVEGTSKIRIWKMLKGALDLFEVAFFVKYFSKPLRFFGGWGVFFVFLSVIDFAFSIILKLKHVKNFSDTPLPEIGALFAILGVLLFMMGLLAEMLLRIYYDNEKRSPYLIKSIVENEI